MTGRIGLRPGGDTAHFATDPMAAMLASAYRYADSSEHRKGVAAFLAKRSPSF
jgi:hypothetical protein